MTKGVDSAVFTYPFYDSVVDGLLQSLKDVTLVYQVLKKQRYSKTTKTVAEFIEKTFGARSEARGREKVDSIFKLSSWAKAAEGVLGKDMN